MTLFAIGPRHSEKQGFIRVKNAVILLSGGLDSSTTLAIAKDQGFNVHALTIFYGQRNHTEIHAAKRVANYFGIKNHCIQHLDLRIFGSSALTDNIAVPDHKNLREEAIPVTYVPARNTIMLSLAMAFAEVSEADDIFFGANVHDYSGYPDCRPDYISAFEKMANLATKRSVDGYRLSVHAPLVNMKKAEIIARGIALGVDYSITHSCYNPHDDLACGECSACHYRRQGFLDAGFKDPTRYV